MGFLTGAKQPLPPMFVEVELFFEREEGISAAIDSRGEPSMLPFLTPAYFDKVISVTRGRVVVMGADELRTQYIAAIRMAFRERLKDGDDPDEDALDEEKRHLIAAVPEDRQTLETVTWDEFQQDLWSDDAWEPEYRYDDGP